MIFSDDLAIDLGSTRARAASARRGLLLDVPAVVARDRFTGEPLEVGDAAFARVGRTGEQIEAVWPVRAGRVSDFDAAKLLVRCMLRSTKIRSGLTRPRVVMAMPAGLTPLEQRALRDVALAGGAGEVFLTPAPFAAALGARSQRESADHVVVDVGAGTTEIGILGRSGAAYQRSVPLGAQLIDDALAEYLRSAHQLSVGSHTLERIKLALKSGTAAVEVRGHDRCEGSPRSLEFDAEEIREALEPSIELLAAQIRGLVVEAPPELCAEAAAHPLLLAGGGGQLSGFAERIEKSIFLPVVTLEDPAHAVLRGCVACVENLDRLKDVVLERPCPIRPLEPAAA